MKKYLGIIGVLVALFIGANPEGLLNYSLRAYLYTQGIKFKKITTENFTVGCFYSEGGHDENIILLHGLGGKAASTWFTVLPDLAENFNVIAPDLLLANLVEDSSSDYLLDQDVNLVVELARQLNVEKAVVAGLSVGGWLACRLAVDYPGLCDKLILVDSAGIETEALLKTVSSRKDEFGVWFYNNIFS